MSVSDVVHGSSAGIATSAYDTNGILKAVGADGLGFACAQGVQTSRGPRRTVFESLKRGGLSRIPVQRAVQRNYKARAAFLVNRCTDPGQRIVEAMNVNDVGIERQHCGFQSPCITKADRAFRAACGNRQIAPYRCVVVTEGVFDGKDSDLVAGDARLMRSQIAHRIRFRAADPRH